jgi:hypothetical protein
MSLYNATFYPPANTSDDEVITLPLAPDGPVTTAPNLLAFNPFGSTVVLPCCILQDEHDGQFVDTISPILAAPVPFTNLSGDPVETVPFHTKGVPALTQVPNA